MDKLKVVALFLIVVGTLVGTTSIGIYMYDKSAVKSELKKNVLGAVDECGSTNKDYSVIIENNIVIPGNTQASTCDTLTITNNDNKQRLIAFGYHDKHIYYNGIEQETLGGGDSFQVTLNQSGKFNFHDHLQEEVRGSFSVTK